MIAGISLGLGLDERFFEGNRAGDSYWCMRIIHYPPLPAAEDTSLPPDGDIERSTQLSCGEHTDYGMPHTRCLRRPHRSPIATLIRANHMVAASLFCVLPSGLRRPAACPIWAAGSAAESCTRAGCAGLLTLVNQEPGITALQVR